MARRLVTAVSSPRLAARHGLHGLLAVIVAACGHLLLAQQPQQAPESQGPLATFRTGVEAVQIDAFVTGEDGRPVTDLTIDDFEVLENGVPRPIVAFSRVNLPIDEGHGPVEQWGVTPDVAANDGPEGRLYLFALDEVPAQFVLQSRAFLRRFLEEHFQPNDMGAIVLTGRGLTTDGQPFTADPRLLLAAFDKYTGGFDERQPCGPATRLTSAANDPAGMPLPRIATSDYYVRDRLARLRQLTEQLAALPAGRKTLVYVTRCIGFDMFDIVDYRGGVLSIAAEDAHAAMAAATRGNVVIYPIDPAGLSFDGGFEKLEARVDLAAVVSATGGFALSNSNGFTAAFERIVQDASTYYVLGFTAATERRDGRYVRLEIRVRRPGVQVRARDGYVAPMGRAPRAPAPRAPAVEALATPMMVRGVPLRAVAAPYKGSDGNAAVALAFEVDTAALPFVEQDGTLRSRLEVSYGATDLRNRAHAGAAHIVNLERRADAPASDSGQWLRIATQLRLPAGQHQIRVAAGGAALGGSVVYDLEVPDFERGALVLSGVSITAASAATMLTLRPAPGEGGRSTTRCRPPSCVLPLSTDGAPSGEDPLRDALPGPATTAREFDPSDRLAIFVEAYENLRRPSSHTIAVTTTLRGDDGGVILVSEEGRDSTAPARPSGGHGFSVQFPLQAVPPGRYLLQVDARSSAGNGATASRAVPIRILD